jgi:hypothetical protein
MSSTLSVAMSPMVRDVSDAKGHLCIAPPHSVRVADVADVAVLCACACIRALLGSVSWGGIGGGTVNHPPHGVPPHQGVTPEESAQYIAEAVALAKRSDIAIVGLGLCGDNCMHANPRQPLLHPLGVHTAKPGHCLSCHADGLNTGRKVGDPEGEDTTCFTIQETETTDRRSLALPGLQLPLLKAIVGTGTPVVLFVINAGPVDLSWSVRCAALRCAALRCAALRCVVVQLPPPPHTHTVVVLNCQPVCV